MNFAPRTLAIPEQTTGPAVEWEEVDCRLCGCGRWKTIIEAPDGSPGGGGLWFAVAQCQECGLCYTNPRPSRQSIQQFYPLRYWPERPQKILPLLRRLPWLNELHPSGDGRQELRRHGRGRMLDFGCGAGSFLKRMHNRGWHVVGLDISAEAVQRIHDDLGLHALVGTLPHPNLAAESFDLVTMRQSLEHVHDPLELLRETHRVLASGGKLLVTVPNIDSLPFRWFGRAWYGLDLPRHLTHFTGPTLRLMLEQAGFRVGPMQMVRHAAWLRSSAKLACQNRRVPAWHRWLSGKFASRLASWFCYLTQQADCLLVTATKVG